MDTERTNPRRRIRRRAGRKEDRPRQEIQYTQPKPFFRKKLIVQLLTVAAVALAIAVGTSVFFKVEEVRVAGNEKYTAYSVTEAAGIQKGDSLLFFGRGSAAKKIKDALPYVGTVRFQIELPGTVNIIIEEKTVAYALEATDGSMWKMTADGVIVEKLEQGADVGPTITGVMLKDPAVGEAAVAAGNTQDGEVTTNAERLQAAVLILEQMEYWQLFSDVTQVDVSDLFALKLYCDTHYRIELGTSSDMKDKIGAVKAVLVDSQRPNSGVLELEYADEKWKIVYYAWP